MLSLLPVEAVDFVVVDTETTGGRAETDHVIDVAAFHVRDGRVINRFETLVNPGRPIPPWITGLTGISDDMVSGAPRFAEIAQDLASFLSKGVFTAHNAPFDFSFLREEFARQGTPFSPPTLCTVRLARLLFPELPSRSLGALCEHLMIDIQDRHRAAGDAEATVHVLRKLLRKAAVEHGALLWGDMESLLARDPLKLPAGWTLGTIEKLPAAAGAYVFRDAEGRVIYRGEADNVRERVRRHFSMANRSIRTRRLRLSAATVVFEPA